MREGLEWFGFDDEFDDELDCFTHRGKESPYKVEDDAVVAEARRLLAVCFWSKECCHFLSALMITSVSGCVDDGVDEWHGE